MPNFPKGKTLLAVASILLVILFFGLSVYDFTGVRTFLVRAGKAAVVIVLQIPGLIAIGWRLIRWVKPEEKRSILYSCFAAALGIGIVSHTFLLLGLIGLLYPITGWFFFGLLVVIGFVDLWGNRETIQAWFASLRSHVGQISLFTSAALILVASYLIYPVLADAFIPPLETDVIAYHLPIPEIYIENHEVVAIPFIPHSNWPLGFEMVFTFQMLLGEGWPVLSTDILVHLMSYLTFLLIVGAAALTIHRHFDTRTALFVAMLMASIYTFMSLSATGMIDVPVSMFVFFAALNFFEWVLKSDHSSLVLSAIFAGFAASMKLNAAVYAVILAAFAFLRLALQQDIREGLRRFVQFGLISTLVVLPWYVKSWILVGNPIWPFLPELFGPAIYWDTVGQQAWIQYTRSPNKPLTLVNWLRGLIDMTTSPESYGGGWRLGPNLLVFTPFLFFGFLLLRDKLRIVFLTGCGLLIALYTNWFFTTQQVRFFLPIVPVMVWMIGMGMGSIFRMEKRILNLLLLLGLVGYFFAGSWLFNPTERERMISNWTYESGAVGSSEFLRDRLDIHESIEYLNGQTDPDAKILLALYEPRGYYLEREYFWLNPTAQSTFQLELYESAEELRKDLVESGFTHILMNPRWGPQLEEIPYSQKYEEILFDLLKSLPLEFEARRIGVYSLTTGTK